MEIKKFKELTQNELDLIIDTHFNHWVKFNPIMQKERTENKFKGDRCQNLFLFCFHSWKYLL